MNDVDGSKEKIKVQKKVVLMRLQERKKGLDSAEVRSI